MAFDIQPIVDEVAEGILLWCGVDSPTPVQLLVAELASDAAKQCIRHYRRQEFDDALEADYVPLAIEMGVYLYQKRGVDGATSFSENGVSRSFSAGSIPKDYTSRISLPVVAG